MIFPIAADEYGLSYDLFLLHGPPDYICSENDAELTAAEVRERIGRPNLQALFIEPSRPWENDYNESWIGKLRDELLNDEIVYTLKEAKLLSERSRVNYKTIRPHSPLAYRPPAPQAINRLVRPVSATQQ